MLLAKTDREVDAFACIVDILDAPQLDFRISLQETGQPGREPGRREVGRQGHADPAATSRRRQRFQRRSDIVVLEIAATGQIKTRAQHHQFDLGRNSGNPQTIICNGRDDPSYVRPMSGFVQRIGIPHQIIARSWQPRSIAKIPSDQIVDIAIEIAVERHQRMRPFAVAVEGQCPLLDRRAFLRVAVGGTWTTAEHVEQGRVLRGAADIAAARESLTETIEIADVIIPGHDNLLLNPTRWPM